MLHVVTMSWDALTTAAVADALIPVVVMTALVCCHPAGPLVRSGDGFAGVNHRFCHCCGGVGHGRRYGTPMLAAEASSRQVLFQLAFVHS